MRVYDPKSVVCIFDSVPIFGYAPGTFVTVEMTTDAFVRYIGVSGESARARTNDRSGRVSMTLLQSSPTNTVFTLLHTSDILLTSGLGLSVFAMKDLTGSSIAISKACWIASPPSVSFGNEAQSWTWTIDCAELAIGAGGGSNPSV